jgi:hypothetical protein
MSVYFHAFCEDCGDDVRTCRVCVKTRTNFLSDKCSSCYENYCCHWAEQQYQDDPSVKALYLCESCEENRYQASAEVWSYWYWPADRDEPLSPTNVYRVPRFRSVSEGTNDPVERANEALAAYNEEMKFSGDEEEALKIYTSFYNRGSPDPKAKKQLREGFVSLQEILKGQPVTGHQFFEALKYPERDSEESCIGKNPETMTKHELQRAIDKAILDTKQVMGRNRGKRISDSDSLLLDQINEWSKQLFSELRGR